MLEVSGRSIRRWAVALIAGRGTTTALAQHADTTVANYFPGTVMSVAYDKHNPENVGTEFAPEVGCMVDDGSEHCCGFIEPTTSKQEVSGSDPSHRDQSLEPRS